MWLFVTLLSCIFLQTNAGTANFHPEAETDAKITVASTDVGEFKIITAVATTGNDKDFKIVGSVTTGTIKYIGVKYVSGGDCGLPLSTALTKTDSIWLAMDTEFGLAATTDIYISRQVAAVGDAFCAQCFDNTGTAMSCTWVLSKANGGETGATNLSTLPTNGWWVTKGVANTNQQIKLANNLGYLCAAKDSEGSNGVSIRTSTGTEILAKQTLVTSGSTLPWSIKHGIFMTNTAASELSFNDVTADELAACRTFGATMAKMEAAHTTNNIWVTSPESGAIGAAQFRIDNTVDAHVTLTWISTTIDSVAIKGSGADQTAFDAASDFDTGTHLTLPEHNDVVLGPLHFYKKILSTGANNEFGGILCKVGTTNTKCAFSLKFATTWPDTITTDVWNINAPLEANNGKAAENGLTFSSGLNFGWLKFVSAGANSKLIFSDEGTSSTSTYGQLSTNVISSTANTQKNIFVSKLIAAKARYELATAANKDATSTDSWFGYSWKNDPSSATIDATAEGFDLILEQGVETTFKITSAKIVQNDGIKFDVDSLQQGETIIKMGGGADSSCADANDVYFFNDKYQSKCTTAAASHKLTLEKTSALQGRQYIVATRVASIGNTNLAVDISATAVSGSLTSGSYAHIKTGTPGFGSLKFATGTFDKDVQLFVVSTTSKQLFLKFGLTAAPTAIQGTTDNDGDTVSIDLNESKHIRLGRSTINAASADGFMGVSCFDDAGTAVECHILAFHNTVTNVGKDTDGAASGSNTAEVVLPMAREWFISKLPAGDRKFKRTAVNFLGFSTKKSTATAWKLEDDTSTTLITDIIAAASATVAYATSGTPKTSETPFIKVYSDADANALSITAAANQYVGVLSGTMDGKIPSAASSKIYYYPDNNCVNYINLQTGTAVPKLLEIAFVGTKPKGFAYRDAAGAVQRGNIADADSIIDNTNDINKVYIWDTAMTVSQHLHTNCYSAVSASSTVSKCQFSIRSIVTADAPSDNTMVDGSWFIYKGGADTWGPTLTTSATDGTISHFKHGGNVAGAYTLIFTDSTANTDRTVKVLDETTAQVTHAKATGADSVRHVTIQHEVQGSGKKFYAGFKTAAANQFFAYSWDNDVANVDLGAVTILDVISSKAGNAYTPIVKSTGFTSNTEYWFKIDELNAANDDIRLYGAETLFGLDARTKYLKFTQNKDHVKIAANPTIPSAGLTLNVFVESPTTKLFRVSKVGTIGDETHVATVETGTAAPSAAPTTAAPTTTVPTTASDSSMYTYSHGFIFILSIITLIGNFIIY